MKAISVEFYMIECTLFLYMMMVDNKIVDIIQKLIEFDRQCVEKVELAKKKKAEAQSSMMSQKSTIYSEYIDSQQDQVEKHKQDLLNKNKEEAQLQENEFHKSMKNMEDLFTQNKDKWVDEIFTRCTK